MYQSLEASPTTSESSVMFMLRSCIKLIHMKRGRNI